MFQAKLIKKYISCPTFFSFYIPLSISFFLSALSALTIPAFYMSFPLLNLSLTLVFPSQSPSIYLVLPTPISRSPPNSDQPLYIALFLYTHRRLSTVYSPCVFLFPFHLFILFYMYMFLFSFPPSVLLYFRPLLSLPLHIYHSLT